MILWLTETTHEPLSPGGRGTVPTSFSICGGNASGPIHGSRQTQKSVTRDLDLVASIQYIRISVNPWPISDVSGSPTTWLRDFAVRTPGEMPPLFHHIDIWGLGKPLGPGNPASSGASTSQPGREHCLACTQLGWDTPLAKKWTLSQQVGSLQPWAAKLSPA
jgi:hypothetical protein